MNSYEDKDNRIFGWIQDADVSFSPDEESKILRHFMEQIEKLYETPPALTILGDLTKLVARSTAWLHESVPFSTEISPELRALLAAQHELLPEIIKAAELDLLSIRPGLKGLNKLIKPKVSSLSKQDGYRENAEETLEQNATQILNDHLQERAQHNFWLQVRLMTREWLKNNSEQSTECTVKSVKTCLQEAEIQVSEFTWRKIVPFQSNSSVTIRFSEESVRLAAIANSLRLMNDNLSIVSQVNNLALKTGQSKETIKAWQNRTTSLRELTQDFLQKMMDLEKAMKLLPSASYLQRFDQKPTPLRIILHDSFAVEIIGIYDNQTQHLHPIRVDDAHYKIVPNNITLDFEENGEVRRDNNNLPILVPENQILRRGANGIWEPALIINVESSTRISKPRWVQ
ncbi:MAG: hypothetical protein ABI425_00325 [Patescibacteria group bacterium]